jgi:hypothetical protein
MSPGGHQVAEPRRQAVDQDRPIGPRVKVQRAREIERLLYRLPASAAPLAMRPNALGHFLVAGLGGGEIEAALADQPLGIGALPGACPAENRRSRRSESRGQRGPYSLTPPAPTSSSRHERPGPGERTQR